MTSKIGNSYDLRLIMIIVRYDFTSHSFNQYYNLDQYLKKSNR